MLDVAGRGEIHSETRDLRGIFLAFSIALMMWVFMIAGALDVFLRFAH